MPPTGKIEIAAEYCKACGLCVEHCPKGAVRLGSAYNASGYSFAEPAGDGCTGCTGCALCATACPEAAIEVWRG